MQMRIFIVIIIFSLVFPLAGLAQDDYQVTLNQFFADQYLYARTFDNLVLDFTISPDQTDTLNALTVWNRGSARNNYEIDKLVLYADNGNGQFDGFAIDEKLAESNYNTANVWYFNNLTKAISAEGQPGRQR